MDKEARQYHKALKDLSLSCTAFLRQLDQVMKEPESSKRGELIAKLSNALEYANDRARYFSLGVDYRTDKGKGSAKYQKELAEALKREAAREMYNSLKMIMEWVESGHINDEAKKTAYKALEKAEGK